MTTRLSIDPAARDAHFSAEARVAQALIDAAAAVDASIPGRIERALGAGAELIVQHRYDESGPVRVDLVLVHRNGAETALAHQWAAKDAPPIAVNRH